MAYPEKYKYTREHEWVEVNGKVGTVGITDYAQNSLGDIVYVELPKVGAVLTQFGNAGVIESVKAVSDLYSPVSGEVLETNGALDSDPAAVNTSPYGDGWLFKVRLADRSETAKLLNAADYEKLAAL